MNNYTNTFACRNIFNTIKTSGHSSLEKYIPLTLLKGLCVKGSWRPNKNCNILNPLSTLLAMTAFISCSPGLLYWGLGAQPLLGNGSHSSIFSPTDLNFLSPGLYIKIDAHLLLASVTFALNSTRRQLRLSPNIFDQMHLLFTQVHFFFRQLGLGQYVTVLLYCY